MPRPPYHTSMAIRHRSGDPATVSSVRPARQACESDKASCSCLSRPPHVANGTNTAGPPEVLFESCSPSCSSLITSCRLVVAIPRRPTTTVTLASAFSTILHRFYAARKHEAAEIGTILRSCTSSNPGRPYLVQGLRSTRAEDASSGGSAVAAASVACRTMARMAAAPHASGSLFTTTCTCLWDDRYPVTVDTTLATPC
jgi:hypothetical protein